MRPAHGRLERRWHDRRWHDRRWHDRRWYDPEGDRAAKEPRPPERGETVHRDMVSRYRCQVPSEGGSADVLLTGLDEVLECGRVGHGDIVPGL